ncbi:hypothetical protein ACSFBF_35810, partial [Variovorax sp. ZT5P49]|uniref:hypothetical protein n=1 Tax=Variovorax sp. ZT5P49 TaxID=3443733 RepID=UPI003F454FD8
MQSSTTFKVQPNFSTPSSLSTNLFFATRNFRRKPLKPFQRSLRLCTVFSNRVNFRRLSSPPTINAPEKHQLHRTPEAFISEAHEYMTVSG